MQIAVSKIATSTPLNLTIQPLWDTVNVGIVQSQPLSYFSVPLGTAGKSLVDTNMRQASGLPSPNEFYLRGFSLFPVPRAVENGADVITDKNDIQRCLEWSIFTFFIGTSGRKLVETHAQLLPAGFGVDGFITTGGATSANISHILGNGQRRLDNKFALADYAEKLTSTEAFNATLTFPGRTLSLSNSISLRCYLPGIYGQSIG